MKQWFALTGRETILSQAELLRFVDDSAIDFYRDIAISSAPQPDWQHLGGILRAGTIIAELPGRDLAAIASQIASSIPPATGKVRLGISWPHGSTQTLKKLAMTVKRLYRASTKQNLRLVLPASSPSLNSAHILHNQLLQTPHAEIIIIEADSRILIGRTDWCQDIDDYTKRDRGRPMRDARVGMLPPKLAQMMINLSGAKPGTWLHDPFCGTGVILQEALLMGYQVSGSDIAPDLLKATKSNLAWLQTTYRGIDSPSALTVQDATKLTLPPGNLTIAAEGYLGNPHLDPAQTDVIKREAQMLNALYTKFFTHLAQTRKDKLVILIALPHWFTKSGQTIELPLLDEIGKIGYTSEQFAPAGHTVLHYRREHQLVGRSIIKLTKENK